MKKENNEENILNLEISIILEEYRSLKNEIVNNLNSARQITNLTLLAVGVLVTAETLNLEHYYPTLFLIISLIFITLALVQLRFVYLVLDMGKYIQNILKTTTMKLLSKYTGNNTKDYEYIFGWDDKGKGPIALRELVIEKIVFFPIAGASFAIPIIAAILSIATFEYMVFINIHQLTLIDQILIGINIIALIYCIFWGILAELKR